jgi:hypothetical protein
MNVRYSYRLEDCEDINEAADRSLPRARRVRFMSLIAGALLLCAPFLAGRGVSHPDQFLLGMSPVAICLVLWGLQSPKKSAKKFYAKAINGTEYQAVITDEGITTLSPTVRTELKWAAFSQIIEGENTMALVYEAVMYLFPRRAFNLEQWDEFLEQVHARVGASAPHPLD